MATSSLLELRQHAKIASTLTQKLALVVIEGGIRLGPLARLQGLPHGFGFRVGELCTNHADYVGLDRDCKALCSEHRDLGRRHGQNDTNILMQAIADGVWVILGGAMQLHGESSYSSGTKFPTQERKAFLPNNC